MLSCSSVFHVQVFIFILFYFVIIIIIIIIFLGGGGEGRVFSVRYRPNAASVGWSPGRKLVMTDMHNQVMVSCL